MDYPHLVLARLYEYIEPIDRGDRYEDPLDAALGKASLGRVTGGGSQLDELGGITFADIEIELANLDDAPRVVADALEAAGAPQGSELLLASDESVLREFGTHQCLAVFLDGISLPAEVYAELDFEAWSRRSARPPARAATAASGRGPRRPASSSSGPTPRRCSRGSSRCSRASRSPRTRGWSSATGSRA